MIPTPRQEVRLDPRPNPVRESPFIISLINIRKHTKPVPRWTGTIRDPFEGGFGWGPLAPERDLNQVYVLAQFKKK